MRKNKVDIITLGCAKNLDDSEQLMGRFKANGYTVAHDPPRVNGEICVVGDSLYDARCAKRLGCRHIAVATGWTSIAALEAEGADYVFGDLADTPRVIAALEGF